MSGQIEVVKYVSNGSNDTYTELSHKSSALRKLFYSDRRTRTDCDRFDKLVNRFNDNTNKFYRNGVPIINVSLLESIILDMETILT